MHPSYQDPQCLLFLTMANNEQARLLHLSIDMEQSHRQEPVFAPSSSSLRFQHQANSKLLSPLSTSFLSFVSVEAQQGHGAWPMTNKQQTHSLISQPDPFKQGFHE